MENTLKMMQSIQRDSLEVADIKEYQVTLDPQIIATAFVRNYGLIQNISQKFYGLTENDVASFSLQTLDNALQTFDEMEKVKFSTYFSTMLRNKLREETQYLNTQKRKANYLATSYEQMVENGFEAISNFIKLDLSSYFNDREQLYCQLMLDGYTNAEIAVKMGLSVMTLCNIRKGMRIKLETSSITG